MSHTATVQRLYEAFGRGDVPSILSAVADDVDWNNSGVYSKECPWNGNFQGKANVPGFFTAVGGELDFQTGVFNPHTYIESGQHVAVLLHLESTLRKNGQPLKNECVHVWRFNDEGKVTSYRHYNDTALELAAWRS